MIVYGFRRGFQWTENPMEKKNWRSLYDSSKKKKGGGTRTVSYMKGRIAIGGKIRHARRANPSKTAVFAPK